MTPSEPPSGSPEIDEAWLKDSVWIRFGAVFHNAKVFINGELVGTNEGGLPTSVLRNELHQ